jgi:two-component system sensor histidine kinase and response regulator WspE
MSGSNLTGLSGMSMLELFRVEVRTHGDTFAAGLTALRDDFAKVATLEPLMRAAHSIKGAGRIVGVEPTVLIAGALESALRAAMNGTIPLDLAGAAVLQRGAELLAELAQSNDSEFDRWLPEQNARVRELVADLTALASGASLAAKPAAVATNPQPSSASEVEAPLKVTPPKVSDLSLLQLFRLEARDHAAAMSKGLVALEEDPLNSQLLEPLMRAAHSIKGAARIINLDAAVQLAHGLEDVLVTAQKGTLRLTPTDIDLLLRGVDLLSTIAECPETDFAQWLPSHNADVRRLMDQLAEMAQWRAVPAKPAAAPAVLSELPVLADTAAYMPANVQTPPGRVPTLVLESADVLGDRRIKLQTETAAREERVVRVSAQSLSRLMSLAGESLVEARWLQPFAKSLFLLKQNQDHLAVVLGEMQQTAATDDGRARATRLLHEARQRVGDCRNLLSDRIGVFEQHARQSDELNSRLYYEVIASRMRPFSDGVQGFPRMVRDLARKLGKKVKLEIHGHNTDVDRDILEKLEAPLNHLLRNAVDHGLEPPPQRAAAGKPEQGTLRLEARHRAGMLSITISDDGQGIALDRLQRKVVERGLSTPELVANMSEQELLDFLFLPGFSTAERVTEVSGRGVGLDVVHSLMTAVGGTVRVSTKVGSGTTFHLRLPITLSVLRAVLVTIGHEPYAFPHNRIDRLLRLPRSDVHTLEGRQYFSIDGRNVGLVMAQQVLELPQSESAGPDLCVVFISDDQHEFGLVVDSFQGEQDLVVRPLDARLGKIANVSAAALLDDGSPVLIVDVDDILRSIDNLLKVGLLGRSPLGTEFAGRLRKRILVVDDSITVREAERQLLVNRGYEVEVAVDGIEGWKAIRDADFDLVVSDIDMPRMNGLEFVKNIKQDTRLKNTPVVIVSYKGREEDRLRGLDAGADYYLTKGSFHDDTLLDAVVDLIGGPE